jgi:hypothetical protein
MKRFFVLALTLVIFSIQAHAATGNGLKAVIDEFNYSLSVEWDQKDQSFLNAQSEKLTRELQRLQQSGISNQELMNQVLLEIKDQNLAREIQTTFSMVSLNAMSAKEAQEHIKTAVSKSYATGASWNGSAFVGVVAALVLIAGVLVLLGQNRIEEGCYQTYQCHDECNGIYCQEVCGYECI